MADVQIPEVKKRRMGGGNVYLRSMTVALGLWLGSMAFLGSILNAIAGGGSFLTFPALIMAGIPPLSANATNTLALWPGAVSSAWTYRRHLGFPPRHIAGLMGVSLLGSIGGTALLLVTPENLLTRLLPWLLGLATLLFLWKMLRPSQPGTAERHLPRVYLAQTGIAIYGGYFGGGMGILMLAAFAWLGIPDIKQMNALKTVLGSVINGVGVIIFVTAGVVSWPEAAIMTVCAILGGQAGARIGTRVPPAILNPFIVDIGLIFTLLLFARS